MAMIMLNFGESEISHCDEIFVFDSVIMMSLLFVMYDIDGLRRRCPWRLF